MDRSFAIAHKAVRPAARRGSSRIARPVPRPHVVDVSRGAGGLRIQAKLRIGQPGDRYEQEADRVADQVMRMPEPGVQRTCAGCEEELQQKPLGETSPEPLALTSADGAAARILRQAIDPEEELPVAEEATTADLMSRSAEGPAPSSTNQLEGRVRSLRGGGQPLPDATRRFFESRFGRDFKAVRVHSDSGADRLARSVDARAFAHGGNLVFAAGQYRPATAPGRRLLAHELTHVVQQTGHGAPRLQRKALCDCTTIGSAPTAAEWTVLGSNFPRLERGDCCVSAPKDPSYNCIAWSVGNTSSWLWKQVDSVYGDNDGTVSISDFDSLYSAHGLKGVTKKTPTKPVVALFAKSGVPTHAARVSTHSCGPLMFESKLGKFVRLVHVMRQLEGGSAYGDIVKFYVKK